MPDPIVSAAPDAFDRDAVKALFALPREELFARGLCLPSGTAMERADVERVAAIVRSALRGR